jgi:hypothetical protein
VSARSRGPAISPSLFAGGQVPAHAAETYEKETGQRGTRPPVATFCTSQAMIGVAQEKANCFRPPAKNKRIRGKFGAGRNAAFVKPHPGRPATVKDYRRPKDPCSLRVVLAPKQTADFQPGGLEEQLESGLGPHRHCSMKARGLPMISTPGPQADNTKPVCVPR